MIHKFKFKHYENSAVYLTDENKLVNNPSIKKMLSKYGKFQTKMQPTKSKL
jgi:hypothetical protein